MELGGCGGGEMFGSSGLVGVWSMFYLQCDGERLEMVFSMRFPILR